MDAGSILRVIIIIMGVVMLGLSLRSLSRRRMEESFSSVWALASIGVVLAGILTNPARWNEFVSPTGLVLIVFVAFCVIFAAYFLSIKVSELIRRTNELAMQVALLNEENSQLRKELTDPAQVSACGCNYGSNKKENPVCDKYPWQSRG